MITEALGPSLEEIFIQANRFFDLSMLLEIAAQIIFRLEWVHSRHISHGQLSPSTFTMGNSIWQTPQVLLADFTDVDGSERSTQQDLQAVGDIVIYLATGYSSWELFLSEKPDLAEVPHCLSKFIYMISESTHNPADYVNLRRHFRDARRCLPGRALLGALRSHDQETLTLKTLSGWKSGRLFDLLSSRLATVGETIGDPKIAWGEDQATFIMRSLNEIMSIYLVLLLRDKPTKKRRKHLNGAYHLPNRLWRDLRWYLGMSRCGSLPLQRLLSINIYKYMGVLLEVVPDYNSHWTKFLSDVAHLQMGLDMDCLPLWRHAWIHWRNCANFLAKR